jgi:hypothetical protein
MGITEDRQICAVHIGEGICDDEHLARCIHCLRTGVLWNPTLPDDVAELQAEVVGLRALVLRLSGRDGSNVVGDGEIDAAMRGEFWVWSEA